MANSNKEKKLKKLINKEYKFVGYKLSKKELTKLQKIYKKIDKLKRKVIIVIPVKEQNE